VLAVDPGREKCGVAVVDSRDGVLARGVVPTRLAPAMAGEWAAAHQPDMLVVGKGTGYKGIRVALRELDMPLTLVNEDHTTLRARRRYFQEHPPRGWRRLIPLGLQTPPIPVDDYAAVLLAEDYFAHARSKAAGLARVAATQESPPPRRNSRP
jgi:RNase H-fold protein (predicted Holliday junction resolvase)